MTQKIKVGSNSPISGPSHLTWKPASGSELEKFLEATGRPIDVCNRIRSESIGILGGCIQPGVGGRTTGLVLGRVQSGKTSSFTAVSALAHDNGFKLVIVIAGTTHLLVEQTSDRLIKDLRLNEATSYQRWTACPISDKDTAKASAAMQNLKTRLSALTDSEEPLFAGVPIVVVMKNKSHLDKLNDLLEEAQKINGINLATLPTLIIDDEAHMHSPEVGDDESPSAVYMCLHRLTGNFANHSLLQYTATPQANLLMEIADEMSPDFVRILEPGPGYVGGKEIFNPMPNPKIRNIPIDEYPKSPTTTDPIPPSLKSALANFLLVCACDFVINNVADPRSMLVHSDVKTGVHKTYEYWITTLRDSWKILLEDASVPMPNVFIAELEDLKKTRNDISEKNIKIEDLRSTLVKVLLSVRIQTINHKSDVGKVNYSYAPYWIVNGGNILGVGYTVEGLVTTHMMRKPGAGMADTIQQRGRFFGYLNNRLDSVRVFVTPVMSKRFKDYSDHEEGLRTSLSRYDASNPNYDSVSKPTLKQWKRVFWLDPAMIPTRKKAQKLMLERAQIEKSGWLPQHHPSPTVADDVANLSKLQDFIKTIQEDEAMGWKISDHWGGAPKAKSTTHLEANVPINLVIQFVSGLVFSGRDSGNIFSALLAIEENTLDLENDLALVVLMAQGSDKTFRRVRSLPIDLFQGKSAGRGEYVGDRKVLAGNRVTLQIHLLDLIESVNSKNPPIRRDATTIALHLPTKIHDWAKNILKQP